MPDWQKKKSKIDSFLAISIFLGRSSKQNNLLIFKKATNLFNDLEWNSNLEIQIWSSEAHFPMLRKEKA